MNLKRRFDGFLSEEHIKQQLIALAILLVFNLFRDIGFFTIGLNLQEGATALERNEQVGGHRK